MRGGDCNVKINIWYNVYWTNNWS